MAILSGASAFHFVSNEKLESEKLQVKSGNIRVKKGTEIEGQLFVLFNVEREMVQIIVHFHSTFLIA